MSRSRNLCRNLFCLLCYMAVNNLEGKAMFAVQLRKIVIPPCSCSQHVERGLELWTKPLVNHDKDYESSEKI